MTQEELKYRDIKRKQDAFMFDCICSSFLEKLRGSKNGR